jgi:hypothetical protein
MDLFRKVRVLVGALAHKPFAAGPGERVTGGAEDTGGTEDAAGGERKKRDARSGLERRQAPVDDAERVADLIAEKRRERGA